MPWVGLQFVIVVFHDHSHLLFVNYTCLHASSHFSNMALAAVRSKAVVLLLLLYCLLLFPLYSVEVFGLCLLCYAKFHF